MTTRYVVAQSPPNGTWSHYLCGWCAHGGPPASGWVASPDIAHGVPVWLRDRKEALVFDKETALQLVDQFDTRYRRVVLHHIEELP